MAYIDISYTLEEQKKYESYNVTCIPITTLLEETEGSFCHVIYKMYQLYLETELWNWTLWKQLCILYITVSYTYNFIICFQLIISKQDPVSTW